MKNVTVTTQSLNFLNALSTTLTCASVSEGRDTLCGINLCLRGGKLEVSATTGHILVKRVIDLTTPTTDEFNVTIKVDGLKDAIKRAEKYIKKNKNNNFNMDIMDITYDDKLNTITFEDATSSFECYENVYPNIEDQ